MPQPIEQLTRPPQLEGVLCDIDDTVTWEGKVIPEALVAMRELQDRGLKVIPVTGRPAGWVDHIARMWPVDGVVGENGGLWYWMADGKLHQHYLQPEDERAANQARLKQLASTILQAVPGTALASDQAFRALDLAIDFCEDVPPLGDQAIDAIVDCFEHAGATCKVSSIHVNGWFGDFDKLRGFHALHQARWGAADPSRWAYFGDSANDEPMFEAFPLSIGVRNVERFLPRLTHPPAWITKGNGGFGFVEGVRILLDRM